MARMFIPADQVREGEPRRYCSKEAVAAGHFNDYLDDSVPLDYPMHTSLPRNTTPEYMGLLVALVDRPEEK